MALTSAKRSLSELGAQNSVHALLMADNPMRGARAWSYMVPDIKVQSYSGLAKDIHGYESMGCCHTIDGLAVNMIMKHYEAETLDELHLQLCTD